MPRSARALIVELVADVTDFVKGTDKADRALDDFVTDAESGIRDVNTAMDKLDVNGRVFDEVGDSAKRAADKAERSFDNLAREAKTSFDKVERSADDAARGIGKESFGESGREAGAEFASNLGESISSGDYAALGRDTAAGLVSGFQSIPGIGAAMAVAAAGAAVVFANIQKKAEEAATLTQQAFENMAAGVLESLNQTLRGQQFITTLEQLGGGKAGKGMEKLVDLTNKAGVNAVDFKNALISGGAPLQTQIQKLQAVVDKGKTIDSNWRTSNTKTAQAARAAEALLKQTGKVETSIKKGSEQAAVLNSVLGDKEAQQAVDERTRALKTQKDDTNSTAAAQERANRAFIDPRILTAIDERTRALGRQRTAQEQLNAVTPTGPVGTIVGGRRPVG